MHWIAQYSPETVSATRSMPTSWPVPKSVRQGNSLHSHTFFSIPRNFGSIRRYARTNSSNFVPFSASEREVSRYFFKMSSNEIVIASPDCSCAYFCRRRPSPMHKKRAHFLLMHSTEARPKALHEYMKRKCAQTGASSLTCCSCMKCLVVFLWNSLLALMLNSNAVGGGAESLPSVHRPMSCFSGGATALKTPQIISNPLP